MLQLSLFSEKLSKICSPFQDFIYIIVRAQIIPPEKSWLELNFIKGDGEGKYSFDLI